MENTQDGAAETVSSTDWLDALPAVGGRRIDCSIATYERRALMALKAEQKKIAPDNTLIAVLCDAVRLGREYCDAMKEPQSASNGEVCDSGKPETETEGA